MRYGNGSFVMIMREELTSQGFKQLSSSAKVVFIVAKYESGYQNRPRKGERMYGKYDGTYKCEFVLPYTMIHRYTNLTVPTISKALKDLVQGGFLEKTVNGGLRGVGGVPSRYKLSLTWQESSPTIKQKRTIRFKKKIPVNDNHKKTSMMVSEEDIVLSNVRTRNNTVN